MARETLTPKQQRFVEEYLVDLNATQAAIRAGYAEKWAGRNADKLTKNNEVVAEIERRRAVKSEQHNITVDRILMEYENIAFSDISDYVDTSNGKVVVRDLSELTDRQRRAVSEIKEGKDGVTVKLYSKTSALDSLSKFFGVNYERIMKTLQAMPEVNEAGDALAFTNFLIRAVKNGDLPLTQAAALAGLAQQARQAIDTDVLAKKLDELEAAISDG